MEQLAWKVRFSTSMADPIIRGLVLGQIIRKTHVQYWMEKTLVYLSELQNLGRLGPVTISLDNQPISDWNQISALRSDCVVTKVAEKNAAFLSAVDANELHTKNECVNDTYQIFATEAQNFTVGITALSEEALRSDTYINVDNWKTLPHDLDSFGVSGLYLDNEKSSAKHVRVLEDKAFDQLSCSTNRYIELNGMYLGMHCGDFGTSQIQVLKNNDDQIIGVRSLIWPDAFDHQNTVTSIQKSVHEHTPQGLEL